MFIERVSRVVFLRYCSGELPKRSDEKVLRWRAYDIGCTFKEEEHDEYCAF